MIEILCRREPWSDSVAVAVLDVGHAGRSYAESMTMRKLAEGEAISEPTMRLTNHAAQKLIDELWHCGLRPSEGTGSAGAMAATEKHLKDMRAIAVGLLRKDGVNLQGEA